MRHFVSISLVVSGFAMFGCASDDARRAEKLYPQAYGFENNPNVARDKQKVQQVEANERGFFE